MIFGASTTANNTGASSLTFSSPNVSGNNKIGIVGVLVQTDLSITGITWNGVAMTFIAGKTDAATSERVEQWYIINPTAGVTNVIISRTGSSNALIGAALYYSSAKQSAQPDANTTDRQTTGTYAVNLTTIADQAVILMVSRGASGNTFTAGANTTIRVQASIVVSESSVKTPPGSYAMNLTCSSQEINSVLGSFAPFTDSITVTDTETASDSVSYAFSTTPTDSMTAADTVSTNSPKWKNIQKSDSSTNQWNNVPKSNG